MAIYQVKFVSRKDPHLNNVLYEISTYELPQDVIWTGTYDTDGKIVLIEQPPATTPPATTAAAGEPAPASGSSEGPAGGT